MLGPAQIRSTTVLLCSEYDKNMVTYFCKSIYLKSRHVSGAYGKYHLSAPGALAFRAVWIQLFTPVISDQPR